MKSYKIIFKKILVVSFMIIYLSSFYLNFFVNWFVNFFNIASAQEPQQTNINLIAIFVEKGIYNDLKSDIHWYSQYIQNKYQNTKTLILPINSKNFSALDIKKIIENLYFEWEKDKASSLEGIILIWNIPLPLVEKQGFIFPSIYPYVDLLYPKYRWNDDKQLFSYNTQNDGKIEIWHSLIFFDKLDEYRKYFEKLKTYANNSNFVDKKFWYADYIWLKQYFNKENLQYYINSFIFAQALSRNFYNRLLFELVNFDYLKDLKDDINYLKEKLNYYSEISNANLQDASKDFDSYKQSSQQLYAKVNDFLQKYGNFVNYSSSIEDVKIPTKIIGQSVSSFIRSFPQLFSVQYISLISDNLKATWRWVYSENYENWDWTGYLFDEVDTLLEKISLKDSITTSEIEKFNKILELALDKKIEQEWYYMLYPILVEEQKYKREYDEYWNEDYYMEYQYENFYFGLPAYKVDTADKLSIYRWTYFNKNKSEQISGLALSSLRQDDINIDVQKLSLGKTFWYFSLQTESNRWYNANNAKKDADMYPSTMCSASETIKEWAQRWWWGASPVNINSDSVMKWKFVLDNYNYKNAWNPSWNTNIWWWIFDIAWSKEVNSEISNAYDWKGYDYFSSFIKTKWLRWNNITYCKSLSKQKKSYVDFFSLFKSDVWNWVYRNIKLYNKDYTFYKENIKSKSICLYYEMWYCGIQWFTDEYYFKYKLFDTRQKHISPTKEQYDGMNYSTLDRPVDEVRYITFQGIWWDVVKLIYPDLWNIEVYKKQGNKYILKSEQEIYQSLKDYLIEKVRKYNEYLSNQLIRSTNYYNLHKSVFDFISSVDRLGTPARTYNLLPEDYFISILWEENLKYIAHLLYYQNIALSEKPYFNTYFDFINFVRANYDINKKIKYVWQNYLGNISTQANIDKALPLYNENWYEAAYIVSDWFDAIVENQLPDIIDQYSQAINNYNSFNSFDLTDLKDLRFYSFSQKCNLWKSSSVIIWQWPDAFKCWLTKELPNWQIWGASQCSFSIWNWWDLQLWKDLYIDNDTNYYKNKYDINLNLDSYSQEDIDDLFFKYIRLSYEDFKNLFPDYDWNLYQNEFVDKYTSSDIQFNLSLIRLVDLQDQSFVDNIRKSVDVQFYPYAYTFAWKNTWEIVIKLNDSTLWDIDVKIAAIWQSCQDNKWFFINWINVCKENFISNLWYGHFAPSKGWELRLKLDIDTPYAGLNVFQFQFCKPLSNVCWLSNKTFVVSAGKIDSIEISSPSNKIVRGTSIPIKVNAYDLFGNPISQTIENYIIKVSTWYLVYGWEKKQSFQISNFKDSYFMIDTSNVDSNISQVELEVVPMSYYNSLNLPTYKKFFDIVDAEIIIQPENIVYDLPENINYYYVDANWKLNVNSNVLPQIKLSLRQLWCANCNISSIVYIQNNNSLFKIWKIKEQPYTIYTWWEYKIFYQKVFQPLDYIIANNNFQTLYLLPTMKAWTDEIKFYLENNVVEKVLSLQVNPAKAEKIELFSEKYTYNSWDNIKLFVSVKDKWDNIITWKNIVVTIWTYGNIHFPDGSFEKNIVVNGVEQLNLQSSWWRWYVYAKIKDLPLSEQKPDYVVFDVKQTLWSKDKLNIMYLSLFGSDWWNLWWYFSENNKIVPNIISSSDKLLAVTTSLIDPKKVYRTEFIIKSDLSILNLSNYNIKLLLEKGDLFYWFFNWDSLKSKVKIWNIKDFYTQVVDVLPTYGEKNYIWYKIEPLDSYILSNELKNWKIYINGDVILDFEIGYIDPRVSILYERDSFKIYFKNKLVGYLKVYRSDNIFVDNYENFVKFVDWLSYTRSFSSIDTSSYNGIVFYDISQTLKDILETSESVEDANKAELSVWFKAKFKNITLFAGGNNVWDSTKVGASEFVINFGDPTLEKISSNEKVPYTSYWKDLWKHIFYSDKDIFKVAYGDFNNDSLKDLFVFYKDGRVRLLKNYGWDYNWIKDLWDLMIIADGIKDVFVSDVDWNGYTDIVVWTQKNRIRVYKNFKWELDVNGNLICIDISGADKWWNVDWLKQLLVEDMDKDGKVDLITLDKNWDVKVFYWPSFVSENSYKCSDDWKEKLQQVLVKSYNIELVSEPVYDTSLLHWKWLKSPFNNDMTDISYNGEWLVSYNSTGDIAYLLNNYSNLVEKWLTQNQSFMSVPNLIWKPVYEYITGSVDYIRLFALTGDIQSYKIFEDINWWNLIDKDVVKITIYITNNSPKNYYLTYIEDLKWPWIIERNNNGRIVSFDAGNLNKDIVVDFNVSPFTFKVDNIIIPSNTTYKFSYNVLYNQISVEPVKISLFDKNNDDYKDIKLSPTNWCIKWYEYALNNGLSRSFTLGIEQLVDNVQTNLNSQINSIKDFVQDITTKVDQGDFSILDQFENNEYWNSYYDNPNVLEDIFNSNYKFESNIQLLQSQAMQKFSAQIDSVLKNLCWGIKLWDNGNCWLPIPFNMAFLSPGVYNIFWCPLAWDPGFPILWYPGTVYTPPPAPAINWLMSPNDNIPMNGAYPSFIRMYISPTLTKSVWLAFCFGNYSIWTTLPPAPFGTVAGNCIVVAWSPKTKCDSNNTNITDYNDDYTVLTDWQIDVANIWVCNKPFYGSFKIFSPLKIEGYSSFDNNFYYDDVNPININSNFWYLTMQNIWGVTEAKELLLKWGKAIDLKIQWWNVRWLVDCIIKKWMDKQIRYIINNLTNMTIYMYLPDFSQLWQWWDKVIENIKNDLKKFSFNIEIDFNVNNFKNGKIIKDVFFPKREVFNNLSENLSNPFEQIAKYFEEVPLVNIHTKTIVIKVPFMTEEALDRQIDYLKEWLIRNGDIARQWIENDYLSTNVSQIISRVEKNIEILEQWKYFPLQLYEYIHVIDKFIDSILCVIDEFLTSLIRWFEINTSRFEAWIDFIITLIQIIKTWQIMIDFSVNWRKSCAKCRQDNYDFYSCVLGVLCIDLPILPIPPFKLPDIYLDFSRIDLGINITIPKFRIVPINMPVFSLPDLPPPFTINVKLPNVPLLPPPPQLPSFEFNIPSWKVDFPPILPPAPKIPEILPEIKMVVDIANWIWKIWCIIKNWIGLVAEWNVKTRIEQLTQRTNRVYPFDFINITIPNPPLYWLDVRAETYMWLKMDFSIFYDNLKSFVDKNINSVTDKIIKDIYKQSGKIQDDLRDLQIEWWTNIDIQAYNKNIIKWKYNVNFVKSYLIEWLKYMLENDKWNNYNVRKKKVENIISILDTSLDIKPNIEWVNNTLDKAKSYLKKLKIEYQVLADEIKSKWWNWLYEQMKQNKYSLVSQKGKEEKVVFATPLFSWNKKIINQLKNANHPFKEYIDLNLRLINWFRNTLNTKSYIELWMDKKSYQDMKGYFNELSFKIEKLWINNSNKNSYILQSFTNWSFDALDLYVDYSSLVKWFYVKWDDWNRWSVLWWEDKGDFVRKNNFYEIVDFNDDWKEDIIWWDTNNIYIKFADENVKLSETNHINKLYVTEIFDAPQDIESKVDKNGYYQIQWDYFKIWSKEYSVEDFISDWQTYDSISISWKVDKDISLYVVRLVPRIDVFNEKFKGNDLFNSLENLYAVVYSKDLLPPDADINNIKLTIDWKEAILGSLNLYPNILFVENRDFNVDNISLVFKDIDFKWYYIQVAGYKVDNLLFNKATPWSNQIVVWKQIWADQLPPEADIKLIRTKMWQVVSQWKYLKWYINTNYKLDIAWTDDNEITMSWITDEKWNIISWSDSYIVNLDNLYFTWTMTNRYFIYARDILWNLSKIQVELKIDIPKIDITSINISPDELFAEIWVKLSETVDDGIIKFFRKRWDIIEILTWFDAGEEISSFVIDPYNKNLTWWAFILSKELYFYDEAKNKIAVLNMDNGEFKLLNTMYTYSVNIDTWIPIILIWNQNNPIFKLYMNPSELIDVQIVWNIFEKKELPEDFGEFSNWLCIYDNLNDTCDIYISKKWLIWVDPEYRSDFIVDYYFDGNVGYIFKKDNENMINVKLKVKLY